MRVNEPLYIPQRMAITRSVLALAAVLYLATSAGAASWTTAGPEGASVRALAVAPSDGNVIYISTRDAAVFKSIDAGTTWQRADTGLPEFNVTSLAIDPTDANRVVAATVGLYRTEDGGATWMLVPPSAGQLVINVAIDPHESATIYATTQSELFRSIDGGISFASASAGLDNSRINVLRVDTTTPGRLYVGTANGVFRSDDGAGSWSLASNGLPTDDILSIDITPGTSAILYAGSNSNGVFRSTNGGESWEPARTGLADLNIRALSVRPANPHEILAGTETGVFFSEDSGNSWLRAPVHVVRIQSVTWTPDGQRVYIASDGAGVFNYPAGAELLVPANAGIIRTTIQIVRIDPQRPSRLFAGTTGGLFVSNDSGATWRLSGAGMTHFDIAALAFDPQAPSRMLAGSINGGAFGSGDSGETWSVVDEFAFPRVSAIVPDGVDTGLWYGATAGGGVYVSRDDGLTWDRSNAGITDLFAKDVVVDPTVAGNAYLATATDVYFTADGALTWERRDGGLPESGINRLAVIEQTPTTVLAATDSGLYRSADRAQTWTRIESGLPPAARFASVTASTAATGAVYLGSASGEVFRSTDSGLTWLALGTDLPSVAVTTLAAHPTRVTGLFAGTRARGVYVANQNCGDAIIDVGETCDDGNVADGDDCPATCGVPNPCAGDCDGNGSVTVDEIVRGVSIALGNTAASECAAMDRDSSGSVTVDEIITALVHALNGCPT